MKKLTTSLTVDADIVTRARAIIEKSGLPFSASKLISTLVFEAFDRIETATPIGASPMIEKLRRAIHGETTVQHSIDGTVAKATAPGLTAADVENIVERLLAQREDETSARVAERPGQYKASKRKA